MISGAAKFRLGRAIHEALSELSLRQSEGVYLTSTERVRDELSAAWAVFEAEYKKDWQEWARRVNEGKVAA